VRPTARSVGTDQCFPFTKVMALIGTAVALVSAVVPARAATLTRRLTAAPSEVSLFEVVRQLDLGDSLAAIAAVGPSSLYLTGSLVNGKGQSTLERVDARSLQPEARADVANMTSTAYGDGALWWATGAPLGGIPGNRPLPPQRQALLKLNPLSLKLEKTFELDHPPLAVTVTGGDLWVGTTASLERLNPLTGSVLADVRLGFAPLSMAGSYDSGFIYVLGYTNSDRLVLADYSASSGVELGYRGLVHDSDGPLAAAPDGVWVNLQDTSTQSTTARLFRGARLQPSSAVGGLKFDANVYTTGDILWLVDSGGQGDTLCADASTGRVRASAGPLGVLWQPAVASQGRSVYLLRDEGTQEQLLQVVPSAECAGARRGQR
jgi:hypothetical protein